MKKFLKSFGVEISLLLILILAIGIIAIKKPDAVLTKLKSLGSSIKPTGSSSPAGSSDSMPTKEISLNGNSPIRVSLPEDTDARLPKNDRVIGFIGTREIIAFPRNRLPKEGLIETQLDGKDFLLYVSEADQRAAGIVPVVNNQKLTFSRDGSYIKDNETGTIWNPANGEAVDGSMKGAVLTLVVGRDVSWDSWSKVFPETKIWQPE